MKKNNFLNKLLLILALPVIILACSDDESPKGTGTDFESIASTSEEGGTVTIPLRNGTISASDIVFGGTAVEGEDFELVGITSEGIQVSITNDDDYEAVETIRLQINTVGNNIHTVTIPTDCSDIVGLDVGAFFVSHWNALEDYGSSTYGPYEIELVRDETDPNRFDFDNLYDSGCDAYMIFDFEAGTVYFPDQAPCDIDLTNSSGTFNIDLCDETTTLTINLNFDGGDWIYRFTKL